MTPSAEQIAQANPKIEHALARPDLDTVLGGVLDTLGSLFDHCLFYLIRDGALKYWTARGLQSMPEANDPLRTPLTVPPDGLLAGQLRAPAPNSFAAEDLAILGPLAQRLTLKGTDRFLLATVVVRDKPVALLYLGELRDEAPYVTDFVAGCTQRLARVMAAGLTNKSTAQSSATDLPKTTDVGKEAKENLPLRPDTARFANGIINGEFPVWRRMNDWRDLSKKLIDWCAIPPFGGGIEPRTVEEAEAILGPKQASALALADAIRTLHHAQGGDPIVTVLWEQAACSGLIAHHLCQQLGLDPSFGFAAGLLRNIGQLALWRLNPKQYPQLLTDAINSRTPLVEAERKQWQTDHHALGAALLTQWGFPAELSAAVASSHWGKNPTTAAVLAVDLAHRYGIGLIPTATDRLNHPGTLPSLGLTEAHLPPLTPQIDQLLPWAAFL